MRVPTLSLVVLAVTVGMVTAACGDAPFLELYEGRAHTNFMINLTADVSDFSNYDESAKSVCGVGLWFLFEDPHYTVKSAFIVDFAAGDYMCEDLDTIAMDRVSSARHAGTYDICMETLTLYRDVDQAGIEYLVVMDTEDLHGVFNDKATSFAITGRSAWTIYKAASYSGTSACVIPYEYDGWYYGLFDVSELNFPNDKVSSIRKGCHSSRVIKYSPKTL